MLNIKTIHTLFEALNEELQTMGVVGEIGLCGGAVMCLVFNARDATKDIDAIFEPSKEIREASIKIAHRKGIAEDWLNDAAKGYFLTQPTKNNVLSLSNLRVWAPDAQYMLAMKCISARFDSHDAQDVKFLIEHLKITTATDAMRSIEAFYPRQQIPAKTQFFLEELFN